MDPVVNILWHRWKERVLKKYYLKTNYKIKFIFNRKGVNEANVYTFLKMKDNFAGYSVGDL